MLVANLDGDLKHHTRARDARVTHGLRPVELSPSHTLCPDRILLFLFIFEIQIPSVSGGKLKGLSRISGIGGFSSERRFQQ